MGSRLGRRVVHFANLPIKVLIPNPPFDCIREFALKTIPSASKIEIRRVVESLYGFHVDDVRTLNMEGKKKKRGGFLAAKPDYKKAYITLKTPLSISPDLFPVAWVQEAMQQKLGGKKAKAKPSVEEGEASQQQHWLDDDRRRREEEEQGRRRGDKRRDFGGDGGKRRDGRWKGKEKMGEMEEEGSRFPWSSMRSWRKEKR